MYGARDEMGKLCQVAGTAVHPAIIPAYRDASFEDIRALIRKETATWAKLRRDPKHFSLVQFHRPREHYSTFVRRYPPSLASLEAPMQVEPSVTSTQATCDFAAKDNAVEGNGKAPMQIEQPSTSGQATSKPTGKADSPEGTLADCRHHRMLLTRQPQKGTPRGQGHTPHINKTRTDQDTLPSPSQSPVRHQVTSATAAAPFRIKKIRIENDSMEIDAPAMPKPQPERIVQPRIPFDVTHAQPS